MAMTKIEVVNKPLRLGEGVVSLTDEQAADRMHNLKKAGKGRYEILRPVEFKVGETLGYEGEVPKFLRDDLEPFASNRAKEEAAGKAKAEADAKKKADDYAKAAAEAEAKAQSSAKGN